MSKFRSSMIYVALISTSGLSGQAYAQAANADNEGVGQSQEIIVTAQKRQQNLLDVPISISAISGAELQSKGIETAADLQQVISGFRYSESNGGTPIFYIRGIGFNESTLGARSNVAVYVDEVAIPFPIATGGVGFDLQRVEVLKGPQGTLFGQNTTSGAINYIAAKPTSDLAASVTAGYGSYDYKTLSGYISGPITQGLTARVAVKYEDGGGYQRSITTGRKNGDFDKLTLRGILNWEPSDTLNLSLTYNGYRDKSELRANQYRQVLFQQDALARRYLPPAVVSLLDNYPVANNNRAVDFGPEQPQQDAKFDQVAVRGDWELTDNVKLTYLYAHSAFNIDRLSDTDGVSIQNFSVRTEGDFKSDSHELRLSGDFLDGRLNFTLGGNYDRSKVNEIDHLLLNETGNAYALVPRAAGNLSAYFNTTDNDIQQKFTSYAGFGALDFKITPSVNFHASGRYTKAKDDFNGCTRDADDGVLANAFNLGVFGGANVIQKGGCITLDVKTFAPIRVTDKLDEHNFSWRIGLDWKPDADSLIYANVSHGFKNGSFPNLSASEATQFKPVTQESLLAYEAGFKLSRLNRAVQLSGAVFYYDYSDKQVRGRVTVPIFGPLEALVNIPKSTVFGLETQIDIRPIDSLKIGLNGTYLDTNIKNFTSYDGLGRLGNFAGESFPNTAALSGNLDIQNDFSVGSYTLSVGGNLSYQGKANSNFGNIPLFNVDEYALLSLRAGLYAPDKRWNIQIYARNITNKYYWISANRSVDTVIRVTGEPQLFGGEFTYKF